MVGFSRLMGEDEVRTYQALVRLRGAIDPLIAAAGGRIVGTAGDSVLADFPSVVNALECAIGMQKVSCSINDPIPAERRLEMRIGINLGDVIVDGTDIFGDGVNIAARLESRARPGTICISQTVYEQVRTKLDLEYRPLGALRVKNIAEPVRAYEVGTAPKLRRRRFPWVPIACGMAVAAAALAGYLLWPHYHHLVLRLGDPAETAPRAEAVVEPASVARTDTRPSVAVLPFKNLSGDASQDFFSDGMTEDIIAALGRFSNLLVISKSSSFQFRNANAAPAEIGRALMARYLLDGSIRRSGKRIRVGVQLTEAATGRLVWSENYNAEIDDIFTVQETIARRVVGAAAVELTRLERERALAKPTSNLAAYEYVLRGRSAWSHETRESNDEAMDLFQRAVDLDPNYAEAYAALGGAYVESVMSGWSEFRIEDIERAEALALKALALNPATTRAYHVLSSVHGFRRRYDLALAQIDRALAFNPSDTDSHVQRGTVLVLAGRAEEAMPWLEAALNFDRANGYAAGYLCMANYFLGRYSAAIQSCDLGLSRDAGHSTRMNLHVILAATFAALDRPQDAARERAIVARSWPFFDARTFAGQFGTEKARDQMLEDLRKAGFR